MPKRSASARIEANYHRGVPEFQQGHKQFLLYLLKLFDLLLLHHILYDEPEVQAELLVGEVGPARMCE